MDIYSLMPRITYLLLYLTSLSILGPDPKRKEEIRVSWTDLMKQQYGKQLEETKVINGDNDDSNNFDNGSMVCTCMD